jgi:hypothetical protein
MRLSRLLVAAPLLGPALLLSRPLAAQTPGAVPREPAAWRPQPSALLAPIPTAQPAEAPGARLEVSEGRHHGKAVALMIVGAAGIVTGLLVEEDIITIAGAAVGGVGLYLYLR